MKLSVLFFLCVRPQLQNWQLSDPHTEDSPPHPPSPLTLERNEEEENFNRQTSSKAKTCQQGKELGKLSDSC